MLSADSPDPLFTSQDGSDSVFNRTDESIIPPNNAEERDVLTDMPKESSAVNRFERFLKERKDSELLNLQKLRENLDDNGNEGTGDTKVRCHSFVDSCTVSSLIERFSNECRKTKTKVISPANHNKRKLPNEPIRTRSNYM